ncbi:MAG: T9SS type A sorting domain-containing protein [Saprospiraceae bacterium]|nr:T9SS type A sorting domain-containing protein [Saprospiraceae bacterium]
MKNLLFPIILFCTSYSIEEVFAQHIVTHAFFPQIGDQLLMASAKRSTTTNISITPSGGNQIWDYRSLQAQAIDTQRFITVSDTTTRRLFPTANLMNPYDSTKQVSIYRRTDSIFELLGYRGLSYQGYFVKWHAVSHTPLTERRAPMKMGESFQTKGGAVTEFPASAAPDSLLRQLPFLTPDSGRLVYDIRRIDTVDAWGIMRLPMGDFPVLRERRHVFRQPKTIVKFNLLGVWLDVTTLVVTGLNEPFRNEQFFTYYWSNISKEPIAIVETDSLNNIESIQYKFDSRVPVQEIAPLDDQITISPNPAHDILTIDLKIALPEVVSVCLVDMTGKMIVKQAFMPKMTVQSLSQGAYLLYLTDKYGRILGRKTVVIQR